MSRTVAMDPLVLSSTFGTVFPSAVHPAPAGVQAVFFSNNPEVEEPARAAGWDFRLVTSHPLTDDVRISSLQSKYVKFLQHYAEFPEFADAPITVYYDHKMPVDRAALDAVLSHLDPARAVLIRYTPVPKPSLLNEVADAMVQPRYAQSMPQTVDWVERLVGERRLTPEVRVMNTGFMVYSQVSAIRPLLDETYATCWRLAQPECQIIWTLLAQQYTHLIQPVEWDDVPAPSFVIPQ